MQLQHVNKIFFVQHNLKGPTLQLTKFRVLLVKVWPFLKLVVVGDEDVEEAQDGQHLKDGLHGQTQEVC